jgi:hypothetical protein
MSNIFLALDRSPSEDLRLRPEACGVDLAPLCGVLAADWMELPGLPEISAEPEKEASDQKTVSCRN